MSALQVYTLVSARMRGRLLAEMTEISIDLNLGRITAKTLQGGVTGVTPGVEECMVTIGELIPVSGFEIDPSQEVSTSTPPSAPVIHDFVFDVAGKICVTQGWFTDSKINQSVGSEAKQNVSIVVKAAPFIGL